jgi:hypothetical protein
MRYLENLILQSQGVQKCQWDLATVLEPVGNSFNAMLLWYKLPNIYMQVLTLCGVIRDTSKGCIFAVFSGVKHKAETWLIDIIGDNCE